MHRELQIAAGRVLLKARCFLAVGVYCASQVAASSQAPPSAQASPAPGNDPRHAEAYYRRMLAQSPNSPELLSNLGIALEMEGRSTEAIYEFELALKQRYMPRTYALLAEEKCKVRDLNSAKPMLARLTREGIQDPATLAVIAPCYLELDEPVESALAYEKLIDYPSYPTDLALIQASKSYLRATQFFIDRLRTAPNNEAYVRAISEARRTGSGDARGAFDAARKESPYFRPDLDFAMAAQRWREHPQDAALIYLLVVLSSEHSMKDVEICGERFPNSPSLVQLQAEMSAHQGDEAEATRKYEELMRDHPELSDLNYDEGMLFRKKRDWDRALNAFRKQLEKEPDDESSAARVSEALVQLGRWTELAEFLSQRINVANPPLWALLDFANASENLNKPDQALTALTTAERIDPSDASIHYRLMVLFRQLGNRPAAERELKLFRPSSN